MRAAASLILAFERGLRSEIPSLTKAKIPSCLDAFGTLQPHLAALVGNGGFRALLLRALELASEEVPWMGTVQVKMDGHLEGLEELHVQLSAEEFSKGEVVLLAQMLGLLVAFIGEKLTLRLAGEVWPVIALNDLDLEESGGRQSDCPSPSIREGDKHERTKGGTPPVEGN